MSVLQYRLVDSYLGRTNPNDSPSEGLSGTKLLYTLFLGSLKDNSTMDKTEAQIVSYGILYLNPSSHHRLAVGATNH